MNITVGRIVHYRLTSHDVERIHQRQTGRHNGNPHQVGQILPLLVCLVWVELGKGNPSVNGQVFLDGNDQLWVTSVQQGDKPGEWFWPPIEK